MTSEYFLFLIFLALGISIGISIGFCNHIVLFLKNNKVVRFVPDLLLPIISGFAFLYLANKYNMGELKKALKKYVEMTGRRITIEYLLIKDLNDTPESAKQLAEYLADIKCNINLIPYNPTEKNDYQRPSGNSIQKFKYLLEHSGKKVTVRLERGADIDAACGQLRGTVEGKV